MRRPALTISDMHNYRCFLWLGAFYERIADVTKENKITIPHRDSQRIKKFLDKPNGKGFNFFDKFNYKGMYQKLLSKLEKNAVKDFSALSDYEKCIYEAIFTTKAPFFQDINSAESKTPARTNSATKEEGLFQRGFRLFNMAAQHAMHTTCFPWMINDKRGFHREGQIRMGSPSLEDGKSVLASFQHFITIQHNNRNDPHLYINLLKNTKGSVVNFERQIETKRSHALHSLEQDSKSPIIVISLPADDRVLSTSWQNDISNVQDLINRAIKGIRKNQHDFYMSDNSKIALFTKEKKIRETIEKLFQQSLAHLFPESREIDFSKKLKHDDLRMIWFDFVKLQLTEYILTKITHSTFNITCKDGIDRAWAHSMYYNEFREHQVECDLSDDAWLKFANRPAEIVKGREMNHHLKLLEKTRKRVKMNFESAQSRGPSCSH